MVKLMAGIDCAVPADRAAIFFRLVHQSLLLIILYSRSGLLFDPERRSKQVQFFYFLR